MPECMVFLQGVGGYAYAVSLVVYQLGNWFTNGVFGVGTVFAIAALAGFIYLLVRKNKYEDFTEYHSERNVITNA
jgi:hypothetical protein